MTTFDPPLAEALTADSEYLSERIETDVNLSPTEARVPGIYILRCCRPDTRDAETHTRHYLQATGHDAIPPYLESVIAADRLYYVGASQSDTYRRLSDHTAGEHRQVAFLKAYPPASIERVELTDADRAFERESALATDLSNERPDAYVHSR